MASLLLACGAGAEAQPRQTSVFDFEDTAIEGELVRPDAALVTARPRPDSPPADPEAAIRRLSGRAEVGQLPAEGLLRLAELLADRASRHRVEAYRAMEAAHVAHGRGDAAARERHGRVRDRELRAARRDEERAVEHLRAVSRFAHRRLRAKALSLEAYLLGSLEREDEAAEAAHRLLRVCPGCEEAADAHLRIAEQAFADAELLVAVEHYRRVLDVPGAGTEQRAYARYKCGWAQLNLGRFADAWAEMDAARREASEQGERSRALVREATRDLVLVLTHLEVDAAGALSRIDALAHDRAEREALADRYEELLRDQGRLGDASAFAAARRAP